LVGLEITADQQLYTLIKGKGKDKDKLYNYTTKKGNPTSINFGEITLNKYLKYKQKYLVLQNINPDTVSINDLDSMSIEEINKKYLKYKAKYLSYKKNL
jgi:hypothetical protein